MAAAKAGCLHGFPGLTAEVIGKYIKIEEATEAGHMRANPKGKQSTTKKSACGRPPTKQEQETEERAQAMDDAMMIPQQQPENRRTKIVYMTTKLAEDWMASDQTGRFPRVSRRGNEYIAVFYIFDANFIKGVPIKSRSKEDLLEAYKHIYKYCEERGFKPRLQRMDNETSELVEEFIKEQKAEVQYAAPESHCPPAEKAVQTFKSYFKSVIFSLPKEFPMGLWCRLLEQTNLGVNIV